MSLRWIELMDMKSLHDWSVLAECELKSIRATRRLLYKEQILLSRQLARIEGAKREALRHRNHQELLMRKELDKKQKKIQSYSSQVYTADETNRKAERRHALIPSPAVPIHDYAASFDTGSSNDTVRVSQAKLLTRPLPPSDMRSPCSEPETDTKQSSDIENSSKEKEIQQKEKPKLQRKPAYADLFPTLPRIVEQIKPESSVSAVEIVKPAVMHKSKDQYKQQLTARTEAKPEAKTDIQISLVVSLPRHSVDSAASEGTPCTLPDIADTQVFFRPYYKQISDKLK